MRERRERGERSQETTRSWSVRALTLPPAALNLDVSMNPIGMPGLRRRAALAALFVAAACSDPNTLPDAQLENVVDTVTISALTGTAIRLPSAFSVADRAVVRTDLSAQFDFAFDILPGSNTPAFLPRSALGFPLEGSLQPGLQEREEAFALILEAEPNGYITRDTIPIALGERYMARSRVVCTGLGIPRYGKLEVLAIDPTARTVTFQVLVGQNCGYNSLVPGIPEE